MFASKMSKHVPRSPSPSVRAKLTCASSPGATSAGCSSEAPQSGSARALARRASIDARFCSSVRVVAASRRWLMAFARPISGARAVNLVSYRTLAARHVISLDRGFSATPKLWASPGAFQARTARRCAAPAISAPPRLSSSTAVFADMRSSVVPRPEMAENKKNMTPE